MGRHCTYSLREGGHRVGKVPRYVGSLDSRVNEILDYVLQVKSIGYVVDA